MFGKYTRAIIAILLASRLLCLLNMTVLGYIDARTLLDLGNDIVTMR